MQCDAEAGELDFGCGYRGETPQKRKVRKAKGCSHPGSHFKKVSSFHDSVFPYFGGQVRSIQALDDALCDYRNLTR